MIMKKQKSAAVQKMINALSFVGGTLAGTDQKIQLDSAGTDTFYTVKEDYKQRVREGVDYINNKMYYSYDSPEYNQNTYDSLYQQQHTVQYGYNQYYQPIQNIQQENDMPDIDKYLGKKKNKTIVQQSSNPVLFAITDSKSPILQKLEMLCAIMGEVYQAQEKTNDLLMKLLDDGNSLNDFDTSNEEDVLYNQQSNLSPEEEIAKLDEMSRKMQEADSIPLEVEEES